MSTAISSRSSLERRVRAGGRFPGRTGVKPDVAVPADKALDTAYLAALDKVKGTIAAKQRPGMAKEIDDAIAKLEKSATKSLGGARMIVT